MADAQFEDGYFETAYRDYESQNPEPKLAHYLRQVKAGLGGADAVRLLDFGCGPGAFLHYISASEPEWHLYGTDLSFEAIDMAEARVPRATIVHLSHDLQSLGPFDVVTALDVAEHVEDLDGLAGEILGLLRPGGRFLCVIPVYDGPLGPIVRLLDRDPTHIQKHSRRTWLQWAATYFDVQQWHGIFRVLATRNTYVHAPTRVLRSIAPAILVTARKRQ